MDIQPVVSLTRKKIYDEVWSIAVSGAAAKYNIPYSAFMKQIRDADIPVPPAGYWTKKEYGKEITATELSGDADEIITLYKSLATVKPRQQIPMKQEMPGKNTNWSEQEKEQSEEVPVVKSEGVYITEFDERLSFLSPDKRAAVLLAADEIALPDENEKMHPKVVAYRKRIVSWEKEIKIKTPYQQRQIKSSPYLKSEISDESLLRVLRLIDALIKAMEPLGYTLDDELGFCYGRDSLQLKISEAKTEISHIITKEEQKAMLLYEDERKRHSWASKPKIPKYDHVYNGHISFGIGKNTRFRDSKSTLLEQRLGEIMLAIIIAINDVKVDREEQEEAERRRQEEKRREEELRQRYNEEVSRTIELENKANDYAMACKIRALIAAVALQSADDESMQGWIVWAKAKADWYDPTVSAEDKFFGKRKHGSSEEDKRPKAKRGYYW